MAHDTAASIIVFDVNETLLDITTLEPLFERVFGDPSVSARVVCAIDPLLPDNDPLGPVHTVRRTGRREPAHAGVNPRRGVADGDIDELKTRMNTMPAHADVVPALSRLRAAGFRLVTLTNSASASSPTPLERAGIGEFFERSFSVESVRKFKPAPETYRQVAEELRVETSALCLVACHLWDTIGAQAAGCRGALVTRPHNAILPAAEVPVPDVVAAELTDLAEQIVQRWKSPQQPSSG
jgi:2-haloacid dehalogenase